MKSIAEMEQAEYARKAEAAKQIREAKASAERKLGQALLNASQADGVKRTFDEQLDQALTWVEKVKRQAEKNTEPKPTEAAQPQPQSYAHAGEYR